MSTVLLLAVLEVGCARHEQSACGDYFERFSACVAKMGPEARAAAESNLRVERARVAAMERDPARHGEVAAACRASLNVLSRSCR